MKTKSKKTNYFFIIILVLASFDIIPLIYTFFFPSINIGATALGSLQQSLRASTPIGSISFTSIFILTCMLVYKSFMMKNSLYKLPAIIVSLLIFITLGFYASLTIFNIILSPFCKNGPFIKDYTKDFPLSKPIEEKFTTIKDEYTKYTKKYLPDCIYKTNPGFAIDSSSNKERCWRNIMLKKAGTIQSSMVEHFPTTISLLKDKQIHNAFFSILDSEVDIPPHDGYYKGYLRYHLGIIIPKNENGDTPFIVCGGETYHWKEGEGVLFDDMYLHYVKNKTPHTRVVLYLDVVRNNLPPVIHQINETVISLIEYNLLLKIMLKNQHLQKSLTETFMNR
jgi:aspartyl/asparaginyl beta-hydroxylase (cupin superfamily)